MDAFFSSTILAMSHHVTILYGAVLWEETKKSPVQSNVSEEPIKTE
jgi:hypothetical protein